MQCPICLDNFLCLRRTDCNHEFCCKCSLTLLCMEESGHTFKCPMCRQTARILDEQRRVLHIKVHHDSQILDFCFYQHPCSNLEPQWSFHDNWYQMTAAQITIAFINETYVTRTRQDLTELREMFWGEIEDIDNPYGKLVLHEPVMNLWKNLLRGMVQAKHKPLLKEIQEIYSLWNRRQNISRNVAALMICTDRFLLTRQGFTCYSLSA